MARTKRALPPCSSHIPRLGRVSEFSTAGSGASAATLKDGSDAPACYLDYSQVLVGWLVGWKVGRLSLVVMKMSNMTCFIIYFIHVFIF